MSMFFLPFSSVSLYEPWHDLKTLFPVHKFHTKGALQSQNWPARPCQTRHVGNEIGFFQEENHYMYMERL